MIKSYVNYEPVATGKDRCENCVYYSGGICSNPIVQDDENVPEDGQGRKEVSPLAWCNEFESITEEIKSMKLKKFIPFVKIDEAKRQVWGIVTAEVPDKEDEVCDYTRSKPYYETVISEMAKATGGQNYFPLREMHQLSAVGKCIGFEFRDDDKEIFMGFEVVDDDAWKKVQKSVYTGFSQGGKLVGDLEPDPVFKGCMRYVADPSECSLVDNPCLGVAHFAYIKADGTLEMRKFQKTETLPSLALLKTLEKEIQILKTAKTPSAATEKPAADAPKPKTKRVAGEDLESSAFAYVGKAEDPTTWKLPLKFKSQQTTKFYLRNQVVRFNRTAPGIPWSERPKVWAKLRSAAIDQKIDPFGEITKIEAIQVLFQKEARIFLNRLNRAEKTQVTSNMSSLDDELGKLRKGMYEVSRLACFVQDLGYLVYNVHAEQEWEGDDSSSVPDMLAESANSLMDALLEMVQEETNELREQIDVQVNS